MYSIWIYIYGKQEIKMQINVSAQTDHPLFVWPLLLLKSENQFFFYFIEELRWARGGRAFWNIRGVGGGGLIFHSAIRIIPLLKFSKMPSVLFVDTSNLHNV